MPVKFWKHVNWSDEFKYELMNTKRKDRIWCQRNQKIFPNFIQANIKHEGGSIMVWVAFLSGSIGNLVKTEEKLTDIGNDALFKYNLNF